jgi:hypothetical protein
MDILVTIASWLFLVGVLMVASSAFPAVTDRFPKMLLWGFLLAAASPFVALLGVVLGG